MFAQLDMTTQCIFPPHLQEVLRMTSQMHWRLIHEDLMNRASFRERQENEIVVRWQLIVFSQVLQKHADGIFLRGHPPNDLLGVDHQTATLLGWLIEKIGSFPCDKREKLCTHRFVSHRAWANAEVPTNRDALWIQVIISTALQMRFLVYATDAEIPLLYRSQVAHIASEATYSQSTIKLATPAHSSHQSMPHRLSVLADYWLNCCELYTKYGVPSSLAAYHLLGYLPLRIVNRPSMYASIHGSGPLFSHVIGLGYR